MSTNNILTIAQNYLQSLPRIYEIEEAKNYSNTVFLLPQNVQFTIREDGLIETIGLKGNLDKKVRDLISVINIDDALTIRYIQTNVLTPLTYAESLNDILWHLNTQGILFTKVNIDTIQWIKHAINYYTYNKHNVDQFWLPFSKPIDNIRNGDILCIFNRRVGGWDGTLERPVIELLGAGGHLPMIWNKRKHMFEPLTVKENLIKELHEELGILINEDEIMIFGGYKNETTHELVVLSGIEIKSSYLPQIQEYAIQGIDASTKGIYLGTFNEVIEYYRSNPGPFAGGSKAAPHNFPNRKELMSRAIEYLSAH